MKCIRCVVLVAGSAWRGREGERREGRGGGGGQDEGTVTEDDMRILSGRTPMHGVRGGESYGGRGGIPDPAGTAIEADGADHACPGLLPPPPGPALLG